MCRFLIVQTKQSIKPFDLLGQFTHVVKNSKTPDGDWQADGWGIAWIDKQNRWQSRKSLRPIWEEIPVFDSFEKTNTFVVHVRSASFPHHKGNIEFNQPYVAGKYAFVFNGLLKGVSLPNIPGKIGAEKIWHLLQRFLQNFSPQEALEKTKELLIKSSREVVALNIGLATSDEIYSQCYFSDNPEYYQLHIIKNDRIKIICSEKIRWTN